MSTELTWSKDRPTKPGWYWNKRQNNKYDEPMIIQVRMFAGELAIGNSNLSAESWDQYEWAGPLPPFPK